MSELDNRLLVEEAFEALNAHDLKRYGNVIDDSYVVETVASPTPIRRREAVRQFITMYFKAFPDFHQEIEQMIVSGDWVVSRWHATGTQKGEFNGIPPTNRKVSVRGCSVSEIKNSRILKTFIFYDQLAILQQLGIAKVASTGS